MNAQARVFTAPLAVREQVPLLVGLMGPSGGGKTFSALRLATGIQQVVGGDIFGIDTEARRMLHYADRFKFRHVPFNEPFGALDYLEALRFCVSQGAKTVIVDSMSHEHEGVGGLLDTQDKELQRLAGDDYGTWKADRFNMLAWQKPKSNRRKLINGLLQMECNFIFCFRAKETSKPVKKQQENGREKTVIEPMGFMPIAGDEFVFEMTMNALLLPNAGGVPTWQSENRGEKMMMKLPEQFRSLMNNPRPLDEKMGVSLAEWARGDLTAAQRAVQAPVSDFPGDQQNSSIARPAPSANNGGADGGALTLAQRADAFRKRVREATTLTKLRAIGSAADALKADLDRSDPDTLVEITEVFQARHDELGEADRQASMAGAQ